MFLRSQPGILKKCLKTLAVITLLAVCVVFVSPGALQVERRDMTRLFTADTLSTSQEGRYSIWLTTWEMIKTAPVFGVGLGNYKWNYLDALSVSQEVYPLRPRYTFWAHNEYLQWIAETGVIGGLLLFSLLIYCISLCIKGMRGENNEKKPFLAWSLAAIIVLMADSCFSRPLHNVGTAFTLSLALAMISRLEAAPIKLSTKMRYGVSGVMLSLCLSGIILFSQSFQGQDYLARYYNNPFYLALASSEEREHYKHPLLLEDAYLQLTARENYNRTLVDFGDTEQNDRDAIRLLTQYFETQPRYKELNYLMLVYQKRNEIEEAQRYFKYYPPEERQKLLDGRFDGKYMTK
jgi:O-antigen ligase